MAHAGVRGRAARAARSARRAPGPRDAGARSSTGRGDRRRRSERPPLGKGAAAPEATGPRPVRLPPWIFSFPEVMDRSERERRTPTDEPRQFSAVDHSARAPMKNAASCENQCELQNAVIIGISNAHGGPGPPRPGPRPPEGRRQTRNRRGPARPGRPRRESAGRQPRGPAPREDTGCRRLEGTAKSQVAAPPPPLSGEDEPHGYPERERENGHRPGAGSAPRAGRRTPRGSPPRRGRSALSIRPTREPVVPQQVERFERWALDPAAGEHPPAGARCPGQI